MPCLIIAQAAALPLSNGIDYVRVILSLVLCLALGVGMAFLARRIHRHRVTGATPNLRVLESIRIDTRSAVHVVRYGHTHVLVTTHPAGIAVTPVEAPSGTPTTEDAP
ncbi:MAG: hypothetical protein GAK28_03870 [Luteibacter sp.]|uniref:flagellar biosynthetic protein FliO n=1 Tax=Luteibacter sp. TaxID=1886636 RepID=UPI001382472E|nr:flagellar biosynthetic protein FliO [Luteibacter sp.]KAF1004668.1 MAG: hypothetical protein GAK28_03870 [Luteibacter sp.]